jgi:hypothetical protein
MTVNVRQAGFRVVIEPDVHLSQFSLKRTVKEGLKEIVETAAGGALLEFHRPNLGDAGGEFILQREWWNKNRNGIDSIAGDQRLRSSARVLVEVRHTKCND